MTWPIYAWPHNRVLAFAIELAWLGLLGGILALAVRARMGGRDDGDVVDAETGLYEPAEPRAHAAAAQLIEWQQAKRRGGRQQRWQ